MGQVKQVAGWSEEWKAKQEVNQETQSTHNNVRHHLPISIVNPLHQALKRVVSGKGDKHRSDHVEYQVLVEAALVSGWLCLKILEFSRNEIYYLRSDNIVANEKDLRSDLCLDSLIHTPFRLYVFWGFWEWRDHHYSKRFWQVESQLERGLFAPFQNSICNSDEEHWICYQKYECSQYDIHNNQSNDPQSKRCVIEISIPFYVRRMFSLHDCPIIDV